MVFYKLEIYRMIHFHQSVFSAIQFYTGPCYIMQINALDEHFTRNICAEVFFSKLDTWQKVPYLFCRLLP